MRKIVLVSCVKSKLNEPANPLYLYTSIPFLQQTTLCNPAKIE